MLASPDNVIEDAELAFMGWIIGAKTAAVSTIFVAAISSEDGPKQCGPEKRRHTESSILRKASGETLVQQGAAHSSSGETKNSRSETLYSRSETDEGNLFQVTLHCR
jgi:hypothetical protein